MPYYSLARDWLPDEAPLNNPGVVDALNVVPHPQGFAPLKELQIIDQISATVTMSVVTGAFAAVSNSTGRKYVYAATSDNKIWVSSPTANPWKDKTGAASINTQFGGTFAKFGDLVILAQTLDSPQKSTLSASAAVFTALAGTPPAAYLVGVVRDFVVFCRTSANRQLVQWSALGNAQDYVASATTQSDSQILGDEGPILGFLGGEYGLVIFERAIYRMVYIGSPAIFQFDKIASGFQFAIGYGESSSFFLGYQAVRHGDDSYFMTVQGLARIKSGQFIELISAKRNGTYFLRTTGAPSGLDIVRDLPKYLALDEANARIYFAYEPDGSSLGAGNAFIYDVILDRYSRATLSAAFAFTGLGYVNVGGNVDYPAGILYFDPQNRLVTHGSMSATNMAAMVESAELEPTPGHRSHIVAVRPGVDGTGTPIMQIGARDKQNEAISFGASVTANTQGICRFRVNGRFLRVRTHMPKGQDWQFMTGFDLQIVPGSER